MHFLLLALPRPIGSYVSQGTDVRGLFADALRPRSVIVIEIAIERSSHSEVDGDQLLGMILQKCAPGLRRRFAAAHHVFADAALTDVDAEFEQFTMDAGVHPNWDSPGTSCRSDL
jgi:hypothetical protein